MPPGPTNPPAPQDPLPERIGQLYFRVALPLVGAVLLTAVPDARPGSLRVLLVLTALTLVTALLHALLPVRWHDLLRRTFPGVTVAFVLGVALLSGPGGLPGDPQLLTLTLLLTPATVLAWTLLFMDEPRTGRLYGLVLTGSAVALLWRWQLRGLQPQLTTHTPLLTLIVCLTVVLYGVAFADINRRYRDGERALRRDTLTGLLNRRAFDEQARASAVGSWALALLDVDHFKGVNDTHGHTAGDRVLRAVADVILDVLAGQGRAYRWGGEEFALLLPGPPAAGSADLTVRVAGLIEDIRAEVARRTFTGGQRVTLSAGLSLSPAGEPLQAAFERADAALRRAKADGRDRVVLAPAPPRPAQTP
ncbi:hypothetical protein GCM10008937_18360 [Deinococcus depolymerans]|uniref:GGDEF domain-containing protein n=2 Tax=Deinococcus depolymerans TaxID=392408 RepID=A0ABN1C388_9DEIO